MGAQSILGTPSGKTTGVAMVGGGRAASAVLALIARDASLQVRGMVEPNPSALGATKARALGIPLVADLQALMARPDVAVVVEVTGREEVRRKVLSLLRPDQEVITSRAARLLVDTVHRHEDAQARLAHLTEKIQRSATAVDETARGSTDVLRELKILAVNASVEAARQGQAGRGFAILVDRMRELSAEMGRTVEGISANSQETRDALALLAEVEAQLRS